MALGTRRSPLLSLCVCTCVCVGVRVEGNACFSPPVGKASRRRRHTCSHLARWAASGSAPRSRGQPGRRAEDPCRCPGRAASVPVPSSSCLTFYQVTWLSVPIVVFFPRLLSWLFQSWHVLLVAGKGQLSGGIIQLHARVSLVLCSAVFLLFHALFSPFLLSANFP